MNDAQHIIEKGLVIWVAAIVALIFCNRKKALAGLLFIWFGDLSINHLFGALIYLVPNYEPQAAYLRVMTADQTANGFFLTSLGMVGFLAGAVIAAPFALKFIRFDKSPSKKSNSSSLPQSLIMSGAFFYFVLRFLQGIPSLGTLSQSGWVLMQVGICLAARNAYLQKNQSGFTVWLIVGLIFFPFFTLIFQGFLGFGIKVMLIILCFTVLYYRDKWKLFVLAPIMLWLGLSLYINYMGARDSLREALPGKERLITAQRFFTDLRGFSIKDNEHLDFINMRLNQNSLVGASIDYLTAGYQEYARGKTIIAAMYAIIPRILWKNKPIVGGSGSLASDYTGLVFADGTAVGVGHPLELYANFGTAGVILGFFVFGLLLGIYDRCAGKALLAGDIKTFLYFFLPGLAFTTTIGSLAEATSSFVAMYVFLFIITRLVFNESAQTKLNSPQLPAVDKKPRVKES